MSLALDVGSHCEHFLNNVFVVHGSISQLGSRWHDKKLHGFPKVKMKVLISASHKARYFISVYKESHVFVLVNISIDNDFVERSISFSYIVDGLAIYIHRSKREEAEFNTLVHHVHSCKPTCFNIVFNVVGANTDLVHERWILSA